jgi:hypothetical protein
MRHAVAFGGSRPPPVGDAPFPHPPPVGYLRWQHRATTDMNPQNLRPPWKPGVSGNPTGRPAGLVSAIRKQTKDGAELVRFFCAVFRDEQVDLDDRMTAATWLADRAFGKPAQMVGLEVAEPTVPVAEIERASEWVRTKLMAYSRRDGGSGTSADDGQRRQSEGTVPQNTSMNSGDPPRPVAFESPAQRVRRELLGET